MSDVKDLAIREEGFLSVLSKALSTPGITVDVIERMLAVQERLMADQRKTAFMAAMARVTPKLPQIDKNGRVSYPTKSGGQVETQYALLEDIDRIIRPIIADEGFSQSYDSEEIAGNKMRITLKVSHAEGHSESKTVTLPMDTSGSKNGTQAVKSTVSYGRRILTEMFFNLIEKGIDTDGNDLTTITAEQATDLEALITEVKADKKRFLAYLKVDAVSAILARDYTKAVQALESKRK